MSRSSRERSSTANQSVTTLAVASGPLSSASNSNSVFIKFPQRAWDICSNPATQHIVSWAPSGERFIVHRLSEFCEDVLPVHFGHKNISSFVRQLNVYGFRKVGSEGLSYAHPLFHRDHRDWSSQINRRRVRAEGAEDDDDDEESKDSASKDISSIKAAMKAMALERETMAAELVRLRLALADTNRDLEMQKSQLNLTNQRLWDELMVLKQNQDAITSTGEMVMSFLANILEGKSGLEAALTAGVKRLNVKALRNAGLFGGSQSAKEASRGMPFEFVKTNGQDTASWGPSSSEAYHPSSSFEGPPPSSSDGATAFSTTVPLNGGGPSDNPPYPSYTSGHAPPPQSSPQGPPPRYPLAPQPLIHPESHSKLDTALAAVMTAGHPPLPSHIIEYPDSPPTPSRSGESVSPVAVQYPVSLLTDEESHASYPAGEAPKSGGSGSGVIALSPMLVPLPDLDFFNLDSFTMGELEAYIAGRSVSVDNGSSRGGGMGGSHGFWDSNHNIINNSNKSIGTSVSVSVGGGGGGSGNGGGGGGGTERSSNAEWKNVKSEDLFQRSDSLRYLDNILSREFSNTGGLDGGAHDNEARPSAPSSLPASTSTASATPMVTNTSLTTGLSTMTNNSSGVVGASLGISAGGVRRHGPHSPTSVRSSEVSSRYSADTFDDDEDDDDAAVVAGGLGSGIGGGNGKNEADEGERESVKFRRANDGSAIPTSRRPSSSPDSRKASVGLGSSAPPREDIMHLALSHVPEAPNNHRIEQLTTQILNSIAQILENSGRYPAIDPNVIRAISNKQCSIVNEAQARKPLAVLLSILAWIGTFVNE